MILMQYIYLHGFASSPDSAKAKYFRNRFEEHKINLEIPDLNQGDFSHLTITRQIAQVADRFGNVPVTLIGSSLGGVCAAHLAQQYPQVQRLILLAPAFGFLSHWLPKQGNEIIKRWQQEEYLMVYHYREKRELPLHYNFVADAVRYREVALQRCLPTLILHGKRDEVIPAQVSVDFASQRDGVELFKLDDNHALGHVMSPIWQKIKTFCNVPESSKLK